MAVIFLAFAFGGEFAEGGKGFDCFIALHGGVRLSDKKKVRV